MCYTDLGDVDVAAVAWATVFGCDCWESTSDWAIRRPGPNWMSNWCKHIVDCLADRWFRTGPSAIAIILDHCHFLVGEKRTHRERRTFWECNVTLWAWFFHTFRTALRVCMAQIAFCSDRSRIIMDHCCFRRWRSHVGSDCRLTVRLMDNWQKYNRDAQAYRINHFRRFMDFYSRFVLLHRTILTDRFERSIVLKSRKDWVWEIIINLMKIS